MVSAPEIRDRDGAHDRLGRALGSLFGRAPRGIQLGIGPMLAACARFGNPERSFRSLHITGTNGKGSVSAMLESVLRVAGLHVGMYTSPHLVRFAERIRIDGAPIDDASLLVHLEAVADGAPELTFFEATTLAAFLAFRAAAIEVAVIEVGIGGRLDATNVLSPEQVIATAITRVAFDHTELLGDTLSEIAGEKAGIAKAGVPMYIGPLDPESRAAVDVVAERVGATVIATTDPARAATLARLVPREDVALAGSYQTENRAVAALVATSLAPLGVAEDAIRKGIAAAKWPGRFETIHARGAEWLLDAAHNPDGAAALATALASDPRDVLVFGTLADKEWPEMLDFVAHVAPSRVYAPPSSGLSTRPAADPTVLAARHPGVAAASVEEALDHAKARAAESGGNRIVVCGSIFLVGEARARLLDLPRDPPLAL